MNDRAGRIVEELVAARGACAMRDVVERLLSNDETVARSERERIAAKARKRAKVLCCDPEAALALNDFALLLEQEGAA